MHTLRFRVPNFCVPEHTPNARMPVRTVQRRPFGLVPKFHLGMRLSAKFHFGGAEPDEA